MADVDQIRTIDVTTYRALSEEARAALDEWLRLTGTDPNVVQSITVDGEFSYGAEIYELDADGKKFLRWDDGASFDAGDPRRPGHELVAAKVHRDVWSTHPFPDRVRDELRMS